MSASTTTASTTETTAVKLKKSSQPAKVQLVAEEDADMDATVAAPKKKSTAAPKKRKAKPQEAAAGADDDEVASAVSEDNETSEVKEKPAKKRKTAAPKKSKAVVAKKAGADADADVAGAIEDEEVDSTDSKKPKKTKNEESKKSRVPRRAKTDIAELKALHAKNKKILAENPEQLEVKDLFSAVLMNSDFLLQLSERIPEKKTVSNKRGKALYGVPGNNQMPDYEAHLNSLPAKEFERLRGKIPVAHGVSYEADVEEDKRFQRSKTLAIAAVNNGVALGSYVDPETKQVRNYLSLADAGKLVTKGVIKEDDLYYADTPCEFKDSGLMFSKKSAREAVGKSPIHFPPPSKKIKVKKTPVADGAAVAAAAATSDSKQSDSSAKKAPKTAVDTKKEVSKGAAESQQTMDGYD